MYVVLFQFLRPQNIIASPSLFRSQNTIELWCCSLPTCSLTSIFELSRNAYDLIGYTLQLNIKSCQIITPSLSASS